MQCAWGLYLAPDDLPVPRNAAVHLAHRHSCNNYMREIATVVLPNRPADIDAGCPGTAGVRAGPQRGAAAEPLLSSAGRPAELILV